RGVTSIYVSHRMDEIFRLCDHVSVLRDGRHVETLPISECDEARLVSLMIGRAIEAVASSASPVPSDGEALAVSGLSSPSRFADVSFALRRGEILGLAGLVGSGRSEIAHALFGMDPSATGEIRVKGRKAEIRTPQD